MGEKYGDSRQGLRSLDKNNIPLISTWLFCPI